MSFRNIRAFVMNVTGNILQPNQNDSEAIKKLPSPFASNGSNSISCQKAISSVNNSDSYGHLQGYRSRFNINAMKQQYYDQQQQQQPVFQTPQQKNYTNNQYQPNNCPRKIDATVSDNHSNMNQQPSTEQNSSFWCELCERSFRTLQMLERHVDEHEKCYFDGCKYEAHTILVQKHIEMQHNTGLFQQINNTETEEDIEKWRAERKKRYPTKVNIELRQKAQDARLKRGERLNEPKNRFGKSNDRRAAQSNPNDKNGNKQQSQTNRKNRKRPRKRNIKKSNEAENANSNVNEKEAGQIAVRSFKGIPNVVPSVDNTITKPPDAIESKTNALSALCMYSSDSDNENADEEDAEMQETVPFVKESLTYDGVSNNPIDNTGSSSQPSPIGTTSQIVPLNIIYQNLRETKEPGESIVSDVSVPNNDSDDEPPEELPIKHESEFNCTEMKMDKPQTESNASVLKRSNNSIGESGPSDSKKSKKPTLLDLSKRYRKQNTLLEKLLEKDIRHERNVLLQCVRYVVANEFFGVGSTEKD